MKGARRGGGYARGELGGDMSAIHINPLSYAVGVNGDDCVIQTACTAQDVQIRLANYRKR